MSSPKFFRAFQVPSFGLPKGTSEFHLTPIKKFVTGYNSNTGLEFITTLKTYMSDSLGLNVVGSDYNSDSRSEYIYFHVTDEDVRHVNKIFELISTFISDNMVFRVPKLLTLVSNRCKYDYTFLSRAQVYYNFSMFESGLDLNQARQETDRILQIIYRNANRSN